MKISMKHIGTLFKKDLKGVLLNKNIMITSLLPIFFCLFYTNIFGSNDEMHIESILVLCMVLAFSIAPLSVLGSMVAEEKEKKTLRSLFLANVKASEFLISKVLVSLLIILLEAIAIFFICEIQINAFPIFLIMTVLTAFGIMFFGATVGIVAKDQMNAGALSTPLMLLLMFPALFGEVSPLLKKISYIVPTTSFRNVMFNFLFDGTLTAQSSLIGYGVCVVWIVLGIAVFTFAYKKVNLD